MPFRGMKLPYETPFIVNSMFQKNNSVMASRPSMVKETDKNACASKSSDERTSGVRYLGNRVFFNETRRSLKRVGIQELQDCSKLDYEESLKFNEEYRKEYDIGLQPKQSTQGIDLQPNQSTQGLQPKQSTHDIGLQPKQFRRKSTEVLVKSGILYKFCRKKMEPRMFFLFEDVLLCTVPLYKGYRYKLKHEFPLDNIKVIKPSNLNFDKEFSIISTVKSFRVLASTPEERDDWLRALNTTIKEYKNKKANCLPKSTENDEVFALGQQAPVLVPNSRVSMCQRCQEHFSMTIWKHHCRACGGIFCHDCSDNHAPLRYQNNKPGRVCVECFCSLKKEADQLMNSLTHSEQKGDELQESMQVSRCFVRGSSHSHKTISVKAVTEDADNTGYMEVWEDRRWKTRWFVLYDKVLYYYRACEDTGAMKSVDLNYGKVKVMDSSFHHVEPEVLLEVVNKHGSSIIFNTNTQAARDRWLKHISEAVNL